MYFNYWSKLKSVPQCSTWVNVLSYIPPLVVPVRSTRSLHISDGTWRRRGVGCAALSAHFCLLTVTYWGCCNPPYLPPSFSLSAPPTPQTAALSASLSPPLLLLLPPSVSLPPEQKCSRAWSDLSSPAGKRFPSSLGTLFLGSFSAALHAVIWPFPSLSSVWGSSRSLRSSCRPSRSPSASCTSTESWTR